MNGSDDDDFDDFLKRRKPRFRAPDDMFEPPAELDRVVLRQAREAIEADRPVRVFRGPRWAAPIALAATLVLAFTVVFHAGMPTKPAPVPEVTVQNIAERVEIHESAPMESARSAAANKLAREEAAASDTASGTVTVDLASPMMARRESPAAAAPAVAEAERHAAPAAAPMDARSMANAAPPAGSTEVPPWRRDAKTWRAEIERLRNAGDIERADAELAEYTRQQRAYAGAPDR